LPHPRRRDAARRVFAAGDEEWQHGVAS
jgi:hypothetical protein